MPKKQIELSGVIRDAYMYKTAAGFVIRGTVAVDYKKRFSPGNWIITSQVHKIEVEPKSKVILAYTLNSIYALETLRDFDVEM